MNLFNAEAQSRFMVEQARLTLMIGFALLAELFFPMTENISGKGFFTIVMSGAVVGFFLAIVIKMIHNAKQAPVKAMFSDEYTLMLDKTGKSSAYLAMLLALGIQIGVLDLIELNLELSDVAQFNLSLAFIFYGAKVTWKTYKDNQLEQLADE
ncbi:hypothetical protein [Aliikangiella sp. G2MR2-5]|uniref:hypothetical protein n=1 Tax=Aliikangiella sp. G2MR2-5 TaxID=2788943 RepID=UPI0018AA84C2|nr:hypothetical protein [Aliikangiella sp. G2MR2-5]